MGGGTAGALGDVSLCVERPLRVAPLEEEDAEPRGGGGADRAAAFASFTSWIEAAPVAAVDEVREPPKSRMERWRCAGGVFEERAMGA